MADSTISSVTLDTSVANGSSNTDSAAAVLPDDCTVSTTSETSQEAEGLAEKSPPPAAFTTVDLDDPAAGIEGISLGDPQVLQRDVVPMSKRIADFKSWSVTHMKCTRQIISEKLGKGSRTVDRQLDEKIEGLRETQRKYNEIIQLTRKLVVQLRSHVEVQRNLGDSFAEYAVRSPELRDEFKSNSDVQRQAARNGDFLAAVLADFTRNVQTLVSKTMDDTLLKVREYEAARVQYDAFRADLENLRASLVQNPSNAVKKARIEERERDLESHKAKYDQLRADLSVKLRFLDENRVGFSFIWKH